MVENSNFNDDADVTSLSYEQARDELVQIVAQLETGNAPLAQTIAMWERGEAIADHCEQFLQAAKSRFAARTTQIPEQISETSEN